MIFFNIKTGEFRFTLLYFFWFYHESCEYPKKKPSPTEDGQSDEKWGFFTLNPFNGLILTFVCTVKFRTTIEF